MSVVAVVVVVTFTASVVSIYSKLAQSKMKLRKTAFSIQLSPSNPRKNGKRNRKKNGKRSLSREACFASHHWQLAHLLAYLPTGRIAQPEGYN